ncbi:hypothetical protein C0992_000610 [Termitomyces sp. T32_za158]|nr:hypothetical protein C0992_000610 [Termitomyces sp. T32_za158]
MLIILNNFIKQIEQKFVRRNNYSQPDDVELVLEVTKAEETKAEEANSCGYYYVEIPKRRLFWLDSIDLSNDLSAVRGGEVTRTHISKEPGNLFIICSSTKHTVELYLESQYWYHFNLFPNVHAVNQDLYDLVLNTIADGRTDVQTSKTSTINMSKEDLQEMTEVVEGMKSKLAFDETS